MLNFEKNSRKEKKKRSLSRGKTNGQVLYNFSGFQILYRQNKKSHSVAPEAKFDSYNSSRNISIFYDRRHHPPINQICELPRITILMHPDFLNRWLLDFKIGDTCELRN